jgi:hypothetical protein
MPSPVVLTRIMSDSLIWSLHGGGEQFVQARVLKCLHPDGVAIQPHGVTMNLNRFAIGFLVPDWGKLIWQTRSEIGSHAQWVLGRKLPGEASGTIQQKR